MKLREVKTNKDSGKASDNGRFGAMAALARRQYCGKLNVIIPQQV